MQVAPVSRKRATALLAIGGYLNNGILIVQGLIMVPLYLHFIGAHLYGLWMASGGILGLLGVMNFGISSMLIQRIANAFGKNDLEKVSSYFINGMLVYAAIFTVFVVVGMVSSYLVPAVFDVADSSGSMLRACFQVATLAAGLAMLNECLRGLPQALLRPGFSIASTAFARITGILVTAAMLYRGSGLWALPVGLLAAEGLIAISGTIQAVGLFRQFCIKPRYDRRVVKEYLNEGGAMFLARLGSTVSREADPLLITLILQPEVTTVYMLTRRAAEVVSQMLAIMYGAIHGGFSHLVGQGNNDRIAKVATSLAVLVFASGLVGLGTYVGTNNSFVELWVGHEFVLDQKIALIIGAAYFLVNIRNVMLQLLNGFGVYGFTSRVIVFEGFAKTLIAAIWLKYVGLAGAPMSLLLVSLFATVLMFIRLRDSIRLLLTKRDLYVALTLVVAVFVMSNLAAAWFSAHTWTTFVLFVIIMVCGISAALFLSSRSLIMSSLGLGSAVRG